MRIEIQYTIEELAEGISPTPPGARGSSLFSAKTIPRLIRWGFVTVFTVLLAMLTSDALHHRGEVDSRDLATTVYPALFPAVYILLILVWSTWTAWRKTRPGGGRSLALDPNRRTPMLLVLGVGVGMVLGGFIGQAGISLIFPDDSIHIEMTRSQLMWIEYAVWLVDFILLQILGALQRRWGARQQWLANPSWQRAKTLEIDEAGYRMFDAVSRVELAWSCISRVRETRNLFVLQAESGLRYLIPKRGLVDAEELTRARVLIQNVVSDCQFLVAATGFSVLPKPALAGEMQAQAEHSAKS